VNYELKILIVSSPPSVLGCMAALDSAAYDWTHWTELRIHDIIRDGESPLAPVRRIIEECWENDTEYFPSHMLKSIESVIEEDESNNTTNYLKMFPMERHPAGAFENREQVYPVEHSYRFLEHSERRSQSWGNQPVFVDESRISGSTGFCPEALTYTDEISLRLRGLPFDATESDVWAFFDGHARFFRPENPVVLIPNRYGRPSGLAIVSFMNQAAARIAQKDLDRKTMGTRYIEVFGPLKGISRTSNEGSITQITVLQELRAHLSKKDSMLMSMLGVLLSDEARHYLRSNGIGLKEFFEKCADEFVVEGKRGEEQVLRLPTSGAFIGRLPIQRWGKV